MVTSQVNCYKKIIDTIAVPLSFIFNKSFTQGIFPDRLKIPNVIPIFKGGDYNSFNNYRPMSLLPVILKILEKLMFNRILGFLTKYNIITPEKYGFRPAHSTKHAIIDLVNNIIQKLDNKESVISVFLDIFKALNCVDYKILCKKL